MAALLALRSCIGWKNLTTATGCFTDRATHAVSVPWRRCFSQYEQVTSNEDMPIPMENPYKEPLKKCVLCEKRVDYKNVQGTGRSSNHAKSRLNLLPQARSEVLRENYLQCLYSRLCGKKQKEVTKAIKRAQKMGFMPVTYKDPAYLKDPKVCNIRYRE